MTASQLKDMVMNKFAGGRITIEDLGTHVALGGPLRTCENSVNTLSLTVTWIARVHDKQWKFVEEIPTTFVVNTSTIVTSDIENGRCVLTNERHRIVLMDTRHSPRTDHIKDLPAHLLIEK